MTMSRFGTPGTPMQPLKLVADQPKVRVYFIATSLVTRRQEEDGSVSLIYPLISAEGHGAIQMPPIGEYLEVAANVAEILTRQTATYPDGKLVPGMTTDAKYAELIKKSFYEDVPLSRVFADAASESLTDEQVLALVAKRNLQAKAAEAALEESDPESPVRKPGRPKKEVAES